MKIALINKKFLAASASVVALAGSTPAAVVLSVDLSVADTITITATDAVSENTSTGSDGIGIYFENLVPSGQVVGDLSVDGDLSYFGVPSDGAPDLYSFGSDTGLNIWGMSGGTATIEAGVQAFQGSVTFTVDPAIYSDISSGPSTGDVYFSADNAGGLAGAAVIGQYQVIPEPSTSLLGGLAALALLRRRRK
ncbi:MAG: PEP-CTERM sorting domain-containing protein [Akkermansiaceae bacterium]